MGYELRIRTILSLIHVSNILPMGVMNRETVFKIFKKYSHYNQLSSNNSSENSCIKTPMGKKLKHPILLTIIYSEDSNVDPLIYSTTWQSASWISCAKSQYSHDSHVIRVVT